MSVAAVGGAFAGALYLLAKVVANHGEPAIYSTFTWATVGDKVLNFGFLIDGLSVSVLAMGRGWWRQWSSPTPSVICTATTGSPGFFAVISLFTTSMLGLVTSSNIIGYANVLGAHGPLFVSF